MLEKTKKLGNLSDNSVKLMNWVQIYNKCVLNRIFNNMDNWKTPGKTFRLTCKSTFFFLSNQNR